MASISSRDESSNAGDKANRADNQSATGTIAEVNENAEIEKRNRPVNGADNVAPGPYLLLVRQVVAALPWIAHLWMACVAVLAFRLAGGWLVSRRLKSVGLSSCPALWMRTLDDLRLKAGISRQVRFSISALVQVPTVIGWLHPFILVPASVFTGLTPGQLRALLLHELAHIRRHDYLINVLQTVTETLLFYHPAVWWVSNRIRTEREHACDDVAVSICGDSLVYAHALTIVEEMRQEGRAPAFSMAADGGSLVRRIRRLVSPGVYQRESRSLASITLCAVVALTFVAGLLSLAKADGLTRAATVIPNNRRTVAVTFVSLPPLRYGDVDFSELQDINTRLVDRITAHHIPAVGFVGESRVQIPGAEGRRTALLRTWVDAGLDLGNQTYSHPKLYNTPVEEFEQDIIRGEAVTRRLMEEHGKRLRYFSFPYLNTGREIPPLLILEA
jgi:beta-lactamase regulating signal transducer with metallopeptidase domain